jgi:glutamate dehydrogenase
MLGALADLMAPPCAPATSRIISKGDKIIFKFDTSSLALVPEPRPFREIFVFSRRFEGVHLRGGPSPVAACAGPTAWKTTAPKCWAWWRRW